MNLWLNRLVAFAYQYQQEARPYKKLLDDFSSLFQLQGGELVLDIGCGSGRIIRLLMEKSWNRLSKVVSFDNSPSAIMYAKRNLSDILPLLDCSFVIGDVGKPLLFPAERFDLVTACLSLQYAEHRDGNKWSDMAYRNVFKEIYRVLRPGGTLAFSVNTPDSDFSIIVRESWREIFLSRRLPLNIVAAVIMVLQGRWLANQARIGRFHYLPIETVLGFLSDAGFTRPEYKLTYAGLAWVVACRKINGGNTRLQRSRCADKPLTEEAEKTIREAGEKIYGR